MTSSTVSPPSAPPSATAYGQIDSRPLTGHQKSLVALAVVGNIAEFFDIFMVGFVIALLTGAWNLTGVQAGIITSCTGLGTVAGSILWGRMSDRIGRRGSFRCCVIFFLVFTVLTLCIPDGAWYLYAICRVGVGMGVGGLNITSIPYVQEFVPSKQRGLLAGLASVFIPMGLLLGSICQRIVGDNWRVLVSLSLVSALLLIWIHFVPESPRFHLLHGQPEQARRSLAWAMDIPEEEVGALPEIRIERKASYGELFAHHLRPLVIVSLGSFCFILGSFAIQSWGQTLLKDAFGFDTQMVAYLFMGVAVADCIGRFGSAWLADRIGRRWTMFMYGMIGAAACFSAALFHGSGWAFYVEVLVIMMFADGVFGIINAFGSEQFPNEVRSTGIGLGYGLGAIAKIVGPSLMGVLIGGGAVSQSISLGVVTTAFSFFGVCLVLGAIIYLFARETKGADLESL
ncbi:MFS transporter [Bifidobacterium vespertilionis]|uniref:MFS transporter n=1 Tax=Bifidobacterium vespertilionis TaxID=2562524 RepID=A0A5J5DZW4_9BIFI|nr:MFS transporter [Bifidobacterium vespertilionis]KAA8818206.1 MFS transporter [Bifidobacterium vespertilionis]KAA8822385.1 MFS transporter [Bifidobacterium vespertilionis]MBT1179138.1 MFS transporter [Bifidobacterium vespertilionis]